MRFQSKTSDFRSLGVVWTEPKMPLSHNDAVIIVITFIYFVSTWLLLKQTLVNNRLRAIDYANVIRCRFSGLMAVIIQKRTVDVPLYLMPTFAPDLYENNLPFSSDGILPIAMSI